jgi:hypothetical protein
MEANDTKKLEMMTAFLRGMIAEWEKVEDKEYTGWGDDGPFSYGNYDDCYYDGQRAAEIACTKDAAEKATKILNDLGITLTSPV